MSGQSAREPIDDGANRKAALSTLEEALGHRFEDPSLLETALRHSSYAHEAALTAGPDAPALESNERLEFLGDAVLGLVVAQALYAAKPDWREGDLTRSLHAIVEGRSLSRLAERIGVGPVLLLGQTEESSDGRKKPSILENAMEALVGAMYLDAGIAPVEDFVQRYFAEGLAADALRVARDPKTELQETLMAAEGEFPRYRLARDSQVEGDDARFTVEVTFRGEPLAEGVGRTKRTAERRAAKAALEKRSAADAVDPVGAVEASRE